jgi:flagellin-specific chaperone FliS
MTTTQKKVAYAFNKFYLDLINDVKSYDDELKKIVKAKFKVFDKTALTHIEGLKAQLSQHKDDMDSVEMIPGMRTSVLIEDMDEANRNIMKSYYYIFRCLANIYDDNDEGMIDVVLDIIRKVRNGDDASSEIDDVVDDDLKNDLVSLRDVLVDVTKKPTVEDTMKMFENSMIGSLAKEISEEINVKDLNIEDPSELLNFQNMTGSNNVLGSIVSKVSTKIQTKIQDGQLNQGDLISEAMSMIGMLNNFGGGAGSGGNNNLMEMMANINKTMGGAAGIRVDESKLRSMDTRARLRKKLEDKRGGGGAEGSTST